MAVSASADSSASASAGWGDRRSSVLLLGAAGVGLLVALTVVGPPSTASGPYAVWAGLLAVSAACANLGGVGLALHQLRRAERLQHDLEGAVARRTADLSQALRHYRKVMDLSGDPILLCGAARTVRYANPAAVALFASIGIDSPNGRPLLSLFAPEAGARLSQTVERLWRSPLREPFFYTLLAGTEGRQQVVEFGAASWADAEGEGLQVQVVLHDMSQALAHEAAMREQLRFIEQIIEAVPLPLSLRDAAGRMVRVNRAFEEFHGVRRELLQGQAAADVLPAPLAQALARHDGMPGTEDVPARLDGGDGHPRSVLVRSRALRAHDHSLTGVLAIETDVTVLQIKEAELTAGNRRLADLSSQLLAAQEDERRRVARELHDQIGQTLTALKLHLATAQGAPTATSDALRAAAELAEEALAHTRDLTASLHPHVLDDLGLAAALDWLIGRFVRPQLADVRLTCRLDDERADPALELAAFRVMQEALTNVVRHARATRAEVALRASGGWLHAEVRDDGEGFDGSTTWFDSQRRVSLGLAGMRERVEELGGEFDIDSTPGRGTSVRALLPWPALQQPETFLGRHARIAR